MGICSATDKEEFTYNDFIEGIKSRKYKKISFFTGAGISVSSGIPDFRSKDGIYAQLKKDNKFNLQYPEQMFDINYYRQQPLPFLTLAKEFLDKEYYPNIAHHFQKIVENKKQLYKIYTQNVDGLELAAGISTSHLVQAHGHLRSAHCSNCKAAYDIKEFAEHIKQDPIQIYKCEKCQGNIKPDVVFFREGLPWSFYWNYFKISNCDLAIIMGTSLTVQPFAALINKISENTPVILINRDDCTINSKFQKFLHLNGDMNEKIKEIIEKLDWNNDLENLENSQKAATFGAENNSK